MVDPERSLRKRCHVNTDTTGDGFVGIKADTHDANIYFPIGYQLPENDDDLRVDVENLLGILGAFMEEDKPTEAPKFGTLGIKDFPMHAYLKIIRDFLRTGRYYTETDSKYRTDTKGTASWPRTLRQQQPLIQKNGSVVFTSMTVRADKQSASKQITQIHKFCVYAAFEKMGWLYVPFMPEKPEVYPSVGESIYILQIKLAQTHSGMERELFSAMHDMLAYIYEHAPENEYYFGTAYFERIWKKMVDRAFGVKDKDQYFPRTRWLLDPGYQKERISLQPDTIMVYGDNYYIVDAKLYQYGQTHNPDHLPDCADVTKQITYGEYIARMKRVPDMQIYSAFIMPFNKKDNVFLFNENMGNIGEAVADWRWKPTEPHMYNYERIQGIVVDTRFLMYNFIGMPESQKKCLITNIEKVNSRKELSEPIVK